MGYGVEERWDGVWNEVSVSLHKKSKKVKTND